MEIRKQVVRPALWVALACTVGPILLVAVALLMSTPTHAADESLWNKWGAASYATSREDACKKAPAAIDGLAMPEAVREYFKLAAGITCEGGTEAWLVPHQKLEQMWSGLDSHHKGPHVMDKKTVAELPVLKSPDGRPYFKNAVAETAKALSWTFVYEDKTYVLYLPFVCFNWSWTFGSPVALVRVVPPLAPLKGGCPNVYHFKVYVWENKALKLPGVARTHAQEELMESRMFGDAPHVSRTHYTQFQRALISGELNHSTVAHVFRVSLIMTPESLGGEPTITEEEPLGDITVKDTFYEIPFTLEQLKKWDAIRLVPLDDGNIISPPRYHKTGLHEMRFFNHLPNTKLGEWDSNPDPDCVMGEAWIEK